MILMNPPPPQLTNEQLREWHAWTQRRMNDQLKGGGQEYPMEWPEETGRHFEGDIVLGADQAEQIYESMLRSRKRSRHGEDPNGGGDGRAPRTKRKFIGSTVRSAQNSCRLCACQLPNFQHRFVAGTPRNRLFTVLTALTVRELNSTGQKQNCIAFVWFSSARATGDRIGTGALAQHHMPQLPAAQR